MLQHNNILEVLNLNWNHLYPTTTALKLFFRGLRRSKTLTTLCLAWNGFYGPEFMKSFLGAMLKSKVVVLDLEYNRYIYILFEASSNGSIDIDLAYSRLRSAEVQQLISLIIRSKTLEEIYLDGNYLLDADYMAILESMVKSNKMSVVSFGKHTYISKETAAVSV